MERKLYELEYEVAELRKAHLHSITDEVLTLKEVLDLGFNNVHIKGINLFKDTDNSYLADGYYLDDVLLNAQVEYKDYIINDDDIGNYLEVYVGFVDDKYNVLLEKITEE